MIELNVCGYNLEKAKTVAKILEESGYRVRIVDRRDKFSHRHDFYLQISEDSNVRAIDQVYIYDVIYNSDGEQIMEYHRTQSKNKI